MSAQSYQLAPGVARTSPYSTCVSVVHDAQPRSEIRDFPTLTFALQALLARHEAYMASAERDRFEMQSRIEQLETEKRTLEEENARTIQENRALLDQLESYNNSVIDSETQIRSLEATLQSSEQAIRKLQGAEARATEMEDQIADLEAEQAALRNTLVTTEGEAKSAMQRWRRAEKGISDLQEKLERIEREAYEERERHAQVLARMEKQRSMEKDLNTAAGRLKGAAAVKTMGDGGTVVSHFVRDLLQDNANLQVGMAELRELLLNSNDEIQHLREQLIFHQPVEGKENTAAGTLRAELDSDEVEPSSPTSPKSPQQRSRPAASVSQELHIHHHYHVAKPAEPKKPKKKRQNLVPNVFNPSRNFGPSSPPSPGLPHWRLPHTSHSVRDSISTAPSTRWSVFSEQPSDFAPSSVPSSPVSNRRGSIFDRTGHDTSYPTSPVTSIDPTSPAWTRHKKQPSDASRRKFSTPRPLFLDGLPEDHQVTARNYGHGNGSRLRENLPTIMTSSEDGPGPVTTGVSPEELMTDSTASGDAAPNMPPTPYYDDCYSTPTRPRLHRAASSESIMSLTGGLDIHTLKSRPSQLSFRPLGAAMADIELSTVTARPTIARAGTEGRRGSTTLRDKLSNSNIRAGDRSASASLALSSLASTPEVPQRSASSNGFGRLVGWRPWASTNNKGQDSATNTPTSDRSRSISPNPASASSPATSVIDVPQVSSNESSKKPAPKESAFSPRTFGINQPGAIPGFQEYLAYHQRRGPQAKVVPDVVDYDALKEILEEESL